MTEPSVSTEILLQEWREARSSIGRFDEYLLNLRKYGFTLATILIGADAYLSMSTELHPGAKAGAAIAVMMLIVALFLLDHHVKTLQRIALSRAVEIEAQLEMGLSKLRQAATRDWQVTHGGTPTYVLFLFVTGILGITSVLTTALPEEPLFSGLDKWVSLVLVACVCLVSCVLTAAYDWWAKKRLTDVPLRVRQIFRVRKRDKQT
jgi:hypothetical protein